MGLPWQGTRDTGRRRRKPSSTEHHWARSLEEKNKHCTPQQKMLLTLYISPLLPPDCVQVREALVDVVRWEQNSLLLPPNGHLFRFPKQLLFTLFYNISVFLSWSWDSPGAWISFSTRSLATSTVIPSPFTSWTLNYFYEKKFCGTLMHFCQIFTCLSAPAQSPSRTARMVQCRSISARPLGGTCRTASLKIFSFFSFFLHFLSNHLSVRPC